MARRCPRNNGLGFPNVGNFGPTKFALPNEEANQRIDTQSGIVILMSSPDSDFESIGSQHAHH